MSIAIRPLPAVIAAAMIGALTGCAAPDPQPTADAVAPCPEELGDRIADDLDAVGEAPAVIGEELGLPDHRLPHCAFVAGETTWAFYPQEGGAMVDELAALAEQAGFAVDAPPPAFSAHRGDELVAIEEQAFDDAGRPYDDLFDGADYVLVVLSR
ncbi:hypothetical protein [Microbacterium gilvum]|uniref:DUF3558 domain-containing protein n=1 Tax=Microbacterium gilvum TaxID=1336204 RepID=A0ABP8ZWL2_9MICO